MIMVSIGVAIIFLGLILLWFVESKPNWPVPVVSLGVLIGVLMMVVGFAAIVGAVIYTCFTRGW